MNELEVTALLRYVKARCPAQLIDEYTQEAWEPDLVEIDLIEAQEAVRRLTNAGARFVSASEIRAEVLKDVLAPSWIKAFDWCHRVAANQGYGVSAMHPAVAAAYRAMGGAGGDLVNAGTAVRAQFRDAYEDIKKDYDTQILNGSVRDALEDHHSRLARIEANKETKAIEARKQQAKEPEVASPEVVMARLSEMRAVLDKVRRPE